MHGGPPLAVAGGGEGLAEPGGAAIVHRQHRIAAIGQPLVVGVAAVIIPRPGAAVHEQHHRQRLARRGKALGAAAPRQGEIGGEREPVAGGDFQRRHARERRADQFGAADEQAGERTAIAVVEMGFRRCRDRVVDHHPAAIVVGARGDMHVALEPFLQKRQIVADGGIDHVPLGAQIIHRPGLDLVRVRIGHHAGDIRLRRGGDLVHLAGFQILGDECGGIAAAAVDPVQRVAVAGEAHRAGVGAVLEADAGERLVLHHIALHAEEILAAVLARALRQADIEILIHQEAAIALVLQCQRQLAAGQIQAIDIVPARIPVVDADHDMVAHDAGSRRAPAPAHLPAA